MSCNGEFNKGADQLSNLTETLLKCEEEIKTNCNPSNLPHPNATEVGACKGAMDTFKSKSDECKDMSGSDACTCWSDSELATAKKTIEGCDCKLSLIFTKLSSKD